MLPIAGLAVIAALSGCGSNNNPLGVDPGNQQFDTTPPPAPANLQLSSDNAGNPILVWDASSAPDVSAYQVEVYSAYAGGFVPAGDPNATDTSFPISQANGSVQETYRVRAVDTSGNWSAFSSNANVLVPGAGQPAPIGIQ
jgi:hypothetical protein